MAQKRTHDDDAYFTIRTKNRIQKKNVDAFSILRRSINLLKITFVCESGTRRRRRAASQSKQDTSVRIASLFMRCFQKGINFEFRHPFFYYYYYFKRGSGFTRTLMCVRVDSKQKKTHK